MADEAWTALNRIKTVIDALGVYKHTAIVSGETPEVALSSQQLPAVLIVDQGTTEEHVASDDGINHTLAFELHLLVMGKTESGRIKDLVGRQNDILNALEGDSTLAGYFPTWGQAENRTEEPPFERRIVPGTMTYWTTATGR